MLNGDDDARGELLALLETTLGSRGAALLMDYLPTRPGAELATRDDVATLEGRLDGIGVRLDRLDMRLAHQDEVHRLRAEASESRMEALVRERIDSQTKLLMFANVGAVLTAAGIALGSAAL